MAAPMRPDRLLQAAGSPLGALLLAVKAKRWELLARGVLDPVADEVLPVEVRRARRDRAQRLAA